MADSYVQYTATADQQVFTVPFPYLDPTHVIVTLNGVPQLYLKDYVWLTAGSIQFTKGVPAGTIVNFDRITSPDTALVSYSNGSVLTAAELNTATLQNFYRTQELQDQLTQYISGGVTAFSVTGALVGLGPQELIDAVASQILATDLAATLQQNITDITTNSETIAGNTQYINSLQTYQTVGLIETLNLLGTVTNNGTAFVLNTATTQVGGGTTLAQQITQLQTAINGNLASIQANATTVDGLSAQYTVKVDVNGHVAGYGLASEAINGSVTSTFIIDANAFAVIDPGHGLTTPKVPFAVTSGVVYMENVVVNGALIAAASITSAEIANAAIGTAQIANASITAAKIANATITGNLIVDGTITAAHILAGTINSGNMAQGSTSTSSTFSAYPAPGTGGLEIAQNSSTTLFTTTFTGAYTTVISARVNFYAGTSAMDCQADLIIDGVVHDSGYFKVYGSGSTPFQTSVSLMGSISDPGEGAHTVSIVGRNNNTSGFNFWYSMPFLSVLRFLN
jgi:hypothetical protein